MTNIDLFFMICTLINKYEDKLTLTEAGSGDFSFRQLKGRVLIGGVYTNLEYSAPNPIYVSLKTTNIHIYCGMTTVSMLSNISLEDYLRAPLNILESYYFINAYLHNPEKNVTVSYKSKDRAEDHLMILRLAAS
jgi:hypothetical protein